MKGAGIVSNDKEGYRAGRVLEILDSNTIKVLWANNLENTIRLLEVPALDEDDPKYENNMKLLRSLLAGQNVEVSVAEEFYERGSYSSVRPAMVETKSGIDVNNYLIETRKTQ